MGCCMLKGGCGMGWRRLAKSRVLRSEGGGRVSVAPQGLGLILGRLWTVFSF